MVERYKKFLNKEESAAEIVNDLHSSEPDQVKLFADVYVFLIGGKSWPGKHKESPDDIEQIGIWHLTVKNQKKIFYNWHRFRELLVGAFLKAKPHTEDIADIYSRVMWVNSYSGINEYGEVGIWIETEMEKFKCVRCGNCCLNLYDAFCTTADPEDLNRWEKEGRWDILDWVGFISADDRTLADLWISPKTGEEVTRCPWLRKLPKKDKYKCQIQNSKPIHCRKYPKSKKHALTTGCKGFKVQN